jgi:hypothetical protein
MPNCIKEKRMAAPVRSGKAGFRRLTLRVRLLRLEPAIHFTSVPARSARAQNGFVGKDGEWLTGSWN